MAKKLGTILGIIILFIVLAGVVAFSFGTQQAQLGDQPYFESPFFGTVQCNPAPGGAVESGDITTDRLDGSFIVCPGNTKQCDVSITYPNLGLFDLKRRVEFFQCDNTNFVNCGTPQFLTNIEDQGSLTRQKIFSNLPRDKVLYVQFQKIRLSLNWGPDDDNVGRVQLQFIPFVLWNQNSLEGGLNPISGSTDCRLPSSAGYVRNAIVSSTLSTPKGTFDLSKDQLEPSETYNYVAGTVTRATFGNAITFNGQSAYCAENIQGKEDAQVYGLAEITTNSNSFVVVDTNNVLGEVECCVDGRVQLNQVCEDFQLKNIEVDTETGETNIECSFASPCNPGRLTLDESDRTSHEFSCVGGQCVVSDIRVEECVLTSDCGANAVCLNFECTEASTIPTPPVAEEGLSKWQIFWIVIGILLIIGLIVFLIIKLGKK